MKRRFALRSDLPSAECIRRISALLRQEAVSSVCGDASVSSTATPMPVLSTDRRLYSRNNWVGINPFVFVGSIEIALRDLQGQGTALEVAVDQTRAALYFTTGLVLVAMVAAALPRFGVAFLATAAALLFVLLRFLSGSLVRQELKACVTSPRSTGGP